MAPLDATLSKTCYPQLMTHVDVLRMFETLSDDEKSLFVEKLDSRQRDVDLAWKEEIKKRLASIEDGTAKIIEVDDLDSFIESELALALA